MNAAPRASSDEGFALCVYCAASTRDPAYLELAREVGTEIGRRGWVLVSGGGSVSMMGALAGAARAAGARTVGVIPESLLALEVGDQHSTELIVTKTMRERKQVMDDRADAFLALPGGIGTLEELFETWTAATLGMHDKPVVVLDVHGHYTGLLAWLGELVDRGFTDAAALARLRVATSVEHAFELL